MNYENDYKKKYSSERDMYQDYLIFLQEFSKTFPEYTHNTLIYDIIKILFDEDTWDDLNYYLELTSDFDGNIEVSNKIWDWAEDKDFLHFFKILKVKPREYIFLKLEQNDRDSQFDFTYEVGRLDQIYFGTTSYDEIRSYGVLMRYQMY